MLRWYRLHKDVFQIVDELDRSRRESVPDRPSGVNVPLGKITVSLDRDKGDPDLLHGAFVGRRGQESHFIASRDKLLANGTQGHNVAIDWGSRDENEGFRGTSHDFF